MEAGITDHVWMIGEHWWLEASRLENGRSSNFPWGASKSEAYQKSCGHFLHGGRPYVSQAANKSTLINTPDEVALYHAVFIKTGFAPGNWDINRISPGHILRSRNDGNDGNRRVLVAYVVLNDETRAGLLGLAADSRIEIDQEHLAPDAPSWHLVS
jgi:hypothetical protein